MNRGRLLGWILGTAITAGLLVLPFVQRGYTIRLFTTLFFYAAVAQAWNMLGGFSGYLFLGTPGFVGVGAYATGVLMTKAGLPFGLALPLAGLLVTVLALIVGVPILRLRTGYFTIGTLGVAFILRELVNNWVSLTGGGMGLAMPLLDLDIIGLNRFFYFLMLGLVGLGTLMAFLVSRSRLGYGLRAVREDEEAANSLGIHTTLYKVIAFGLTGCLAGLAGGAYAYWLTFLEPGSMFDTVMGVNVIAMVLLGGPGTVFGPLVGAGAITMLSELVWNRFLSIHQGVLGILLIGIVVLMPRGFIEAMTKDGKLLPPKVIWSNLRYNVVRFRV